MIAKMIEVDPVIKLTYDKDQRKFRNDQIEGGSDVFGSRSHVSSANPQESVVAEAASPQSIQKFLSNLGIPNISDSDAQRAADQWVNFIEYVKNDLQWNYGIEYQQPRSDRGMLIDPDKKSLFKRGIEAAGRGLRDLGGAAKNAISQQDPYNPNANRDTMGNLGLDKIQRKPNQGRIDSKKIEQRMKSVQAKLSNLEGEEYNKALNTFDVLRNNWGKVKHALISWPEKNGDWRNYISNQLAALEQQIGIDPDPSLARNSQYIDINNLSDGGNRSRR